MPLIPIIHEPASGQYVFGPTGHSLDPDALKFLELAAKANLPPLTGGTVAEARAAREARKPATPPAEIARIRDLECGGVPCRFYSNAREGTKEGLVVFYHGGGWALGSIDTHDPFCRLISIAANCAVLSVGYGLSPEHPFPQGLLDCLSATRWAHSHASDLGIDPTKIAVCGDSAGGNYAAVVAQTAPCPIKLQVLIYPAVDATMDPVKYPSLVDNAKGLMLETESMAWFYKHYFSADSAVIRTHPLASPILSPPSMLTTLPPSFLLTCGRDPLYSEGKAYAQKLASLGVETEYHEWTGQIHGVATQQIGMSGAVEEIVEAIAGAVKRAFA